MNHRTYDLIMMTGTASLSFGAYLVAGTGIGLMVLGGLLIGLTIVGALLTRTR